MKLNRPASFVNVVRWMFVSGSVILTSAPTRTAPCGSVTCPDIVPEDADCAHPWMAPKPSRTTTPSNWHAEKIDARKFVRLHPSFISPSYPQETAKLVPGC